MYLFINERIIEPYNGEILKRFVGDKLVNVISNPTNENLKEFGYMELNTAPTVEYDETTQFLDKTFYIDNGMIYEKIEVKNINIEDNENINETL